MAPVLDGYSAIIEGLVRFIAAPQIPLKDKELLIEVASATAKREISAYEAARRLDERNREAGRLFKEWLPHGINFINMMVGIGGLLLAYLAYKGNEPPEAVAKQKMDEVMMTQPQTDLRLSFPPMMSIGPLQYPIGHQPKTEQAVGQTAEPETKTENRKTRRRIKKEQRTKRR